MFKIKATFTKDGEQAEAWFSRGSWNVVGAKSRFGDDLVTEEHAIMLASTHRKIAAKRIVENYSPGGIEYQPMILSVELIPHRVKL